MSERREFDGMYYAIFMVGLAVLASNIYYFTFPFFLERGWASRDVVEVLVLLKDDLFSSPYVTKLLTLLLSLLTFIAKSGKTTNKSWAHILSVLGIGLAIFLFPVNPDHWALYDLMAVAGYLTSSTGFSLIGRKAHFSTTETDENDTFKHSRVPIKTNMSVNMRIRYHWKGRWRKGWCNVVAPNRATLIIGGPGAGKSFSLIEQFIEQFAARGVVMACYDFKYPELTNIVYNEANLNAKKYLKTTGKVPTFYAINFTDPLHSNRCNPIAPRYIKEGVDTAEIASIIWENAGTRDKQGGNDFFALSAKQYIDLSILFLSKYRNGIYCTFAHLIELLGLDYRKVFAIMDEDPDLSIKVRPFASALKGKAQNQLQGQIASAQIPLNRFASPSLYWILSGDDIDLNINDPKNPAILCIGNDPERKNTYSTTLALMMGRLFRCCNQQGRLPSAHIIDELPTIKLPELEYHVNTGRSNGMFMTFSIQDNTQLIRDYTKDDAEILLGTAGNIFCGATNVTTAKGISEMIGTQEKEDRSHTISDNSESESLSRKEKQLVKPAQIVNFQRGFFAGRVVDDGKHVVKHKIFCAEFVRDVEARKKRHEKYKPLPYENREDFDIDSQERRMEEHYEDCLVEYVADQIKTEKIKEIRKQAISGPADGLSDDETYKYVARIEIDSYDEAKKESLRKEVKEFLFAKEVESVVRKKYDSIKDDILMLSRTKSEGGVCPDDWETRFDKQGGSAPAAGTAGNADPSQYTGSEAPVTPVFNEDDINTDENPETRE